MEETRQLHLRSALGQTFTEMHDGREHLVVPCIALMQGVIHAVNAETPEFVSVETLKDAAESWNGKPVTLGHPARDGKQCSANDPEVLKAHGIGVLRNSRLSGTKLLMEALVDPDKLRKLGQHALEETLRAGKSIEISVGALVNTEQKAGNWLGRAFKAAWRKTVGDHLAFLPNGRGACSMEMGCGTHRAAMHLVTAEEFVMDTYIDLKDRILALFNEEDLETLSKQECETCNGTGQVKKDDKQEDCPTCHGEGMRMAAMRALLGSRHSKDDMTTIQAMHDHAAKLGAKCDRANYKTLGDSPGHEFHGNQWTEGRGDAYGSSNKQVKGKPITSNIKIGTKVRVNNPEDKTSHGRIATVTDKDVKTGIVTITHGKPTNEGTGHMGSGGFLGPGGRTESLHHSYLVFAEERAIRHEGGRWALYSTDGSRRLGSHNTEAEAEEQRSAIEARLKTEPEPESHRCTCGGH